MILSLPTFVKCPDMSLFRGQENIVFNEDSKLTIDNILPNRYNISFKYHPTTDSDEIWVYVLAEKIAYQKVGITIPIIVMTEDKELLPLCLKDRIVYLQDQLNKGKLNI